MAIKGGKGGKGGRNSGVTIIRREEVVEGGHHGGAWKVAYADFVTAMMAFFLLMWLLNATTEDQRKGLADYFSPNNLLSHASSGTGQPFGGHTVFDKGAMVSDRGAVQVVVGKRPVVQNPPEDDADTPLLADRHGAAPEAGPAGKEASGTPGPADAHSGTPEGAGPSAATLEAANPQTANPLAANPPAGNPPAANPPAANPTAANPPAVSAVTVNPNAAKPADTAQPAPVVARAETPSGRHAPTEAELLAEQQRREKQAFEAAAEEIRQAVRGDPALAELARQLTIDITPEGLRIQLLDEERQPMFATGSSTPNDRARLLLAKVAPVLMRLPEDIAVVGHTDAARFAGTGKSNWELSTERANATRRLLTDAGLAEARVSRVTGLADRDLLLPADPLAAANRRIAIIVLRSTTKPTEPSSAAPSAPASITAPTPSSGPRSIPSSAPPSTVAPVLSSAPASAPPSARSIAPPSAPSAAQPSAQPSAPSPAPPSASLSIPSSVQPSPPSSAPPFAPSSVQASAPSFPPSSYLPPAPSFGPFFAKPTIAAPASPAAPATP
jgi:chemotaxis protein MotB